MPTLTWGVTDYRGESEASRYFLSFALGGDGSDGVVCCGKGEQGDAPYMGPTTCCLALRPGRKYFRKEFEGKGRQAFPCARTVSHPETHVVHYRNMYNPSFGRELDEIDMAVEIPPRLGSSLRKKHAFWPWETDRSGRRGPGRMKIEEEVARYDTIGRTTQSVFRKLFAGGALHLETQ